jgi:hypothetical protein
MEHMLYDTLTKKIQALSTDAVRVRLGPEIRPERMRRYIQRIAHELGVPVTIRRVAGGVIFWRSRRKRGSRPRRWLAGSRARARHGPLARKGASARGRAPAKAGGHSEAGVLISGVGIGRPGAIPSPQ